MAGNQITSATRPGGNLIGNLSYANYPETYVGIPTQELQKVQQHLDTKYRQNKTAYNELDIMLENLPVDDKDYAYKQEAKDLLSSTFQGIKDSNDFESADFVIEDATKKVVTNKGLNGAVKSYENMQNYYTDLNSRVGLDPKDGGITKEQADGLAKISKLNYEGVQLDPITGEASGLFQGITAVRLPDFDEIFKSLDKWNADKSVYGGIYATEDGRIGVARYQDTPDGQYKLFIDVEGISYDDVYGAYKNKLLSDPRAVDWFKQMNMIDSYGKDFNSVDSELLKEFLSIRGYSDKEVNSLTKEEMYNAYLLEQRVDGLVSPHAERISYTKEGLEIQNNKLFDLEMEIAKQQAKAKTESKNNGVYMPIEFIKTSEINFDAPVFSEDLGDYTDLTEYTNKIDELQGEIDNRQVLLNRNDLSPTKKAKLDEEVYQLKNQQLAFKQQMELKNNLYSEFSEVYDVEFSQDEFQKREGLLKDIFNLNKTFLTGIENDEWLQKILKDKNLDYNSDNESFIYKNESKWVFNDNSGVNRKNIVSIPYNAMAEMYRMGLQENVFGFDNQINTDFFRSNTGLDLNEGLLKIRDYAIENGIIDADYNDKFETSENAVNLFNALNSYSSILPMSGVLDNENKAKAYAQDQQYADNVFEGIGDFFGKIGEVLGSTKDQIGDVLSDYKNQYKRYKTEWENFIDTKNNEYSQKVKGYDLTIQQDYKGNLLEIDKKISKMVNNNKENFLFYEQGNGFLPYDNTFKLKTADGKIKISSISSNNVQFDVKSYTDQPLHFAKDGNTESSYGFVGQIKYVDPESEEVYTKDVIMIPNSQALSMDLGKTIRNTMMGEFLHGTDTNPIIGMKTLGDEGGYDALLEMINGTRAENALKVFDLNPNQNKVTTSAYFANGTNISSDFTDPNSVYRFEVTREGTQGNGKFGVKIFKAPYSGKINKANSLGDLNWNLVPVDIEDKGNQTEHTFDNMQQVRQYLDYMTGDSKLIEEMTNYSQNTKVNSIYEDYENRKSGVAFNNQNSNSEFRTDRHNNPTAFTTDIAKQAGLVEGVDYIAGDSFTEKDGSKGVTANIIADPIETTIKVIDQIGFYTQSGQQRWNHTAIPDIVWNTLSKESKIEVIKAMYKKEGGKSLF